MKHVCLNRHRIDWESSAILAIESDYKKRQFLESFNIHKTDFSFNDKHNSFYRGLYKFINFWPPVVAVALVYYHNFLFLLLLLLLLVTLPLPRDWGMTEDHGAPEAGKLSRVWTRGRRETESRQRVSGAKSP